MDRNQVIGIVLILALIFATQYFFAPDPEPTSTAQETEQNADTLAAPSPATPAPAQVIQTPDPSTLDSAQLALLQAQQAGRYGIFAPASQGEAQDVILENDLLKVTLNTQGGMFRAAELKTYQQYWGDANVQLWDPANSEIALEFTALGKGQFRSDDFFFQPSTIRAVAQEGQPAQVVMTLPTADPTKQLTYTYTLAADSYEVDCAIAMVNLQGDINMGDKSAALVWNAQGFHNEKGIRNERSYSSPFFREMDEDRDYLNERTDEDDETVEGRLNWMTFKQHFFSAMVISDEGFAPGAELAVQTPPDTDTLHTKYYTANLPLDLTQGAAAAVPLRFYLGPNEYGALDALEVEDGVRIIDYGWSIFGWVNRNFIRPVYLFMSRYIGSAGVVIILLTFLIKGMLFPVTWKNYLSSARMKVLRPEIEEINKKFKDKPATEKQAATMELYRKTGVNPFAGCIPVLLQMPILYAMFRFFPSSIELRGKSWLWAEDLSAYDAIFSWTGDLGFISTLYGNHISGFTVMMAASTFFYTRMNAASMPQQQQPGMPNMKVIMNIFPFMMLIFFNQFASGLSFYYFISNLISIAQMWIIKKYIIDEEKIRAKIEDNKKSPKKKKSSFQQRLEEMQKVQQERMKQQRGK